MRFSSFTVQLRDFGSFDADGHVRVPVEVVDVQVAEVERLGDPCAEQVAFLP